MQSVVVNGGRAIEVPKELRSLINEIVYDNTLDMLQKHERICYALKIARFTPAPTHKPYALRGTNLEVFDDSRRVLILGGWFQCAYCGFNIDMKPQGHQCPTCGQKSLKNFKWEDPKKKERVVVRK